MALIFDIKRYAINDGPGIRTTIFLKGCPLRCVWCHNPEGWTLQPQKLYKKTKCIGCKSCVDACPQQALELTPDGIRPTSNPCLLCGKCAEECPTTALEMCGKEWSMEALMAEIEKERAIMENSGGGVTLCGGEPLMHADYTLQILHELGRRGFHRTVDTTLYASQETVEKVAEACELFLIDLKLMDSAKHQLYTIEGVNADNENMEATALFLESLPWQRCTVNLLPYHDVGKDKHRRMWSSYNPQGFQMTPPSEETLQHCADLLASHGLTVIIGG